MNYISYHTNRNTYARIKQYQKASSALQGKLNEFFIVREQYDHGTMSEKKVVTFLTSYLEREYMDAKTLTLVYNTIRDANLWDLLPEQYKPVEALYAPDNMIQHGRNVARLSLIAISSIPLGLGFFALTVYEHNRHTTADEMMLLASMLFGLVAVFIMVGWDYWTFGESMEPVIKDDQTITMHHVPVFLERFNEAQKTNALKVNTTHHGRDVKPVGSMTEWFA